MHFFSSYTEVVKIKIMTVSGSTASSSTATSNKKANFDTDKLEYIDALRGIACLSILVYHFSDYLYLADVDVPPSLDPFFRLSSYAVPLFFIVSAFTLYLSLESKRGESRRYAKFYIRRLFRIAPLFYAVLIFFTIRAAIVQDDPPSGAEVLANAFFVFNLIPSYFESIVPTGWTIGVEMLFYLWLPLIFIAVGSFRRSLVFAAGAVVLYHLSKMLLPGIFEGQYGTFSFISQLQVFAIGMVCYFAFKHYSPKINGLHRIPASLCLLLPSFGLFYLLAAQEIFYIVPDGVRRCISLPGWQALAYGFLLLSLSLFSNGVVVNRVTRFYGKISYSIYLTHPILLQSLIPVYGYIAHSTLPIMVSIGLCMLIGILITTPVAMVTYRFIESPGMRYGKKIIARL